MLEQGLNEVAAAVHLQRRPVLCFELLYLFHCVAVDKDGVVPRVLSKCLRNDILRRLIDSRPPIGMLRPVRCEYVESFSAEQEREWPSHLLSHHIAESLVGVG